MVLWNDRSLNGCVCTDFWARYIRFLEPREPEAAKDAMLRAQGIHCKAQPEMQLLAARFLERHGDIGAARAAYELVLSKLAPGLVSAVLACANFERRQVCHSGTTTPVLTLYVLPALARYRRTLVVDFQQHVQP